jgi:hypothetical protein
MLGKHSAEYKQPHLLFKLLAEDDSICGVFLFVLVLKIEPGLPAC